jgi:hypothetical protein
MRESRELMVGEYALQFEIGGVEFKEETIEINDEIARLESCMTSASQSACDLTTSTVAS